MNATADTIFQFKKTLHGLDACMKKANAYADHKKFDVNILVGQRLAPDMWAFGQQIQAACDTAKFCAAYLSAQTPPKHEDNETTWAQLHERLAEVIGYLDGFKPAEFEKAASIQVKPGWAQGKSIVGSEYLYELAIPNFYFHVMTAYAIMRQNGVDIGKMDYLGQINLR